MWSDPLRVLPCTDLHGARTPLNKRTMGGRPPRVCGAAMRDDGVVTPPSPFDRAPAREVNPDRIEGRAVRIAVVLDVRARGVVAPSSAARESMRARRFQSVAA